MAWQFEEARQHFNEFLDAALEKGPQVLVRRGVEEAVLVPIEEWRRLQKNAGPSIKDLLLSEEPRFSNVFPRRRNIKRRPVRTY